MEPLPEPTITPESQITPQPKKRFTKKRIVLIVVAVVVAVGIAGGYWYWQQTSKKPQANQASAPTAQPKDAQVATPIANVSDDLKNFVKPTTGETWLSTPKDMAPQGWVQPEYREYYAKRGIEGDAIEETMKQSVPVYKEVGSRAGNTIVYVSAPGDLIPIECLFEVHPDGTVAIIAKPQNGAKYDDSFLPWLRDEFVSAKVQTIDTSTHYDSLSPPATITFTDGESVLRPEYVGINSAGHGGTEDTTKTKIMDLGGSALYRTEKFYADTKLTSIGYEIHTPIRTIIGMDYVPNALSLEGYTFDNGKSTQVKDYEGKLVYDSLHAVTRGCGGAMAAVTRSDDLKDADLVQVGKTNLGKAVYMLKDKNATLAQKAYQESKSTSADPVSFDTFWSDHGLVFMKNAKNEILAYVRDTYGVLGGCAKPVVYLYPQTAQSVDVRVGANVTISDPYYPVGGWHNVWAQPNGQLTYQGNAYGSLFWEGTGIGNYPSITSGTVVKRADAERTMRRQLAQQGLNAKETSDFMDFWAPKIPDQPYIRLTWLTTAQMDQLAPLSIVPRPDTVKRVFLDMGGFDRPISLPTQKLQSFERRGFTVVEWGGLTTQPVQ